MSTSSPVSIEVVDDVDLIQYVENILGQKKFDTDITQALASFPQHVKEFYQIIHDFNHLKESNDKDKNSKLVSLQGRLVEYFRKNGAKFQPSEDGLIVELPKDKDLTKDPKLQTIVYFQAYALYRLNFNAKGELGFKITDEQFNANCARSSEILDKLVKVNPKNKHVHNLLPLLVSNDDPSIQRKVNLKGAKAGNVACRARVAQSYMSELTGNMLEMNWKFKWPKKVDRDIVIKWLNESLEKGNNKSVSFVGNFINNFFTSARVLADQVTRDNPYQIQRYREWQI